MKDFQDLYDLLEIPLNTDSIGMLQEQLGLRAAWQARVSLAHREREAALDKLKAQVWGDGKTVDDKKIAMKALVAEIQTAVDQFGDAADILKQHISLGQSFLRSMETELKTGLLQ